MTLDQAIIPTMGAAPAAIQFERIRRELAEAAEVDEVKDVRDKAEALRLFCRTRWRSSGRT